MDPVAVLMRRFKISVLAYGLVRGIFYSTQLEHEDTRERMPFGTAAAFTIGTAGMGFLAFPAYLVHDVNYIDRRFVMGELTKHSHRTTFPSPGDYLLPKVTSSDSSSA
jgi:hypothetical protein